MDRCRRAGQMEDFIGLQIERKCNVMADQLEASVEKHVLHIALRARVEVVDAENLVSAPEQTIAQVRADEACSAGNDDTLRLCDHSLTTLAFANLHAADALAKPPNST